MEFRVLGFWQQNMLLANTLEIHKKCVSPQNAQSRTCFLIASKNNWGLCVLKTDILCISEEWRSRKWRPHALLQGAAEKKKSKIIMETWCVFYFAKYAGAQHIWHICWENKPCQVTAPQNAILIPKLREVGPWSHQKLQTKKTKKSKSPRKRA